MVWSRSVRIQIIDVSEGFREEDVQWMLRDRGVVEVKSGENQTGTRVYVNGDLVGVTDNPKLLGLKEDQGRETARPSIFRRRMFATVMKLQMARSSSTAMRVG